MMDHNDKPAQREASGWFSQKHGDVRQALTSQVWGWGTEWTCNRTDWGTLPSSEILGLGVVAGSECGRGRNPERPGRWLSPRSST